jgi:flagellar biosynthesis protein FlhA
MRKMDVGDALQTYTLLSVGDGLCSTLPAFLISTAMGMVVSRAASEADLGRDVVTQITAQPGALKLAAGFMLALGIVCSNRKIPWYPFLVMGVLFFGIAHVIQKSKVQIEIQQESKTEEGKKNRRKSLKALSSLCRLTSYPWK